MGNAMTFISSMDLSARLHRPRNIKSIPVIPVIPGVPASTVICTPVNGSKNNHAFRLPSR